LKLKSKGEVCGNLGENNGGFYFYLLITTIAPRRTNLAPLVLMPISVTSIVTLFP